MRSSRKKILAVLSDGQPKSHREIVKETGLGYGVTGVNLYRGWKAEQVLRTKKPFLESTRLFKGRAGTVRTMRPYHLYLLKPEGVDSLHLDGVDFVSFSEEYLDARGGGGKSKAQRVLDFLEESRDRAWFSVEIAESLKEHGVKIGDIMPNVRRFERRGQLYVRGYMLEERQTPFKEGYLITWMDPHQPREEAIKDAIKRTNQALAERSSTNPTIERIHRIRDIIIEQSTLRCIVGFPYIRNKLGCTPHEAERALTRALQLYPDMKMLKLFKNYRYFRHSSLSEADLGAAVEMKKNYIRMTKGRDNRVGHNWEAVAEWFIDKFTSGAKFWTQNHRTGGMDPRRITLHLIKGVGGRRRAAEVDRVWDVTPGVFSPTITNVLSCKWGLVRKFDVDDFLNVLRWSKEFGADTPDGRQIKQGMVGVFAGSAFNPRENVKLKDGMTISLASYASRANIQILKATDFNEKLRERGCPSSVTVQRTCRVARNEAEVREVLDAVWENSGMADSVLEKVSEKNKDIYEFEKMLESQGK